MSIHTRFPTGLYGITPDWPDFKRLYQAVEQACAAGLPVLQWRRKHTPFDLACQQAQRIAECCKNYGTTFVVNDDWRLALAVDADAVHLGRDDGNINEIKNTLIALKQDLLIGVSCYNQLSLAQQAIANNADYFAFGAVFPSSVKPEAVHAPLTLFKKSQQLLSQQLADQKAKKRPCIVGIGGITLENAKQVIDAGADSIAVISGLFDSTDIYQTCKDFMTLFTTRH